MGGDAGRRTVAAFDLDGTLTRGGSVIPFLVALRGLIPVVAAVVAALPKLVGAAFLSGHRADQAKEALFVRLLAGQPADRVDRIAAAFAERHLRRKLRTEVRDRLEWHRRQGHALVIVSASPECYVRHVAALLGVDAALATRLATNGSGMLTGRYAGKNCRGAEKYARIVTWLRTTSLAGSGTPQPVLWAYGNSRGDLRLLDAADHGVDAGRLGRFGRLRRFPPLAQVVAVERAERGRPPARKAPRRPGRQPGADAPATTWPR